jgi:hypothetical protein
MKTIGSSDDSSPYQQQSFHKSREGIMKSNMEDISVEYRKADLQKRLHLFLTYRDLRSDFMELEKKERPLRYPAASMSFTSPGVCRRLFTRLAGALIILTIST